MVVAFTFLTVLFAFLTVNEHFLAKRRLLEARLQGLTVTDTGVPLKDTGKRKLGLGWLRSFITSFGMARGPMKRLDENLSRADILLKAEEFLLLIVTVMLLTGSLGYMATNRTSVAIIGALVGLALPNIYLRRAQGRRLHAFNTQIADALIVMANTLRAGFGFLQAMEVVRREMPPPISKEFGQALAEMNLGIATEEALWNLARRIKSDDLDLVVTAVIIQRTVGGNLATILDTIAETIRERVRIKGEIKSLTAQGRISGMIVGFLPVGLALFLFLISPKYMSTLINTSMGITLIIVAGVAEAIGALAIKKIISIKV
ncbi:MAG: type II secretion system F family protein [Bacillota bacterium]